MSHIDLRRVYDEAGHENALLVTRVSSLIYLALAAAHWLFLPLGIRLTMTVVAGLSGIVLATMSVAANRLQNASNGKHLIGGVALIALTNVLLHLALESSPHQSSNVMLLLLVFGSLLFDVRWFGGLVVATVVGWSAIEQPWKYQPSLAVHYIYSILISLVASVILFVARRALLRRSVDLAVISEQRAQQLEAALTDVRREQKVNEQLSAILTDFAVVFDASGVAVQYRMPDRIDFLARHFGDEPATWDQFCQRLAELGGDPPRLARAGDMFTQAFEKGQAGAVEMWLQTQNAPRHIYEMRIVPVSRTQVMLVLRDISEVILAQEALIREDAARLKAADLEREIAHRRKAEDELAESLALIRATLETTVDGLLVVDTFGNVRQYNGRFRAQWSLPEDLELWRLQSVVHMILRKEMADNPDLVQAIFHPDALQSSETFHTVTTMDHRDFELYSRVQELAGRKLGRVWTFREVTERTRTLQALRQSESNLHALFASSIQAFALLDRQGIILTFNPTASEYGYKYLNVSLQNGQNLLKIIDAAEFTSAFQEALQGAIVVREYQSAGHDFDFTMVPVYDADAVTGISLSVVNTDDRVAALAALRASEESLRLAVEAGGLILWFYEWSSRRLVWQAGRPGPLVDLLGDLADAPLRGVDAVYEDDRQSVTQAFSAIAEFRQGVDLEFRVRLPDRLAWVHVRGEPIPDGRGGIARLIGIAEDITDRREFQQRLELARDRAEEANRLKNSILTNMSHEIRTPMTSILGFSEILARRLEDPTLKQSALTIQRGGKRLLFLLDNLIDLAKLEVNRLDLRPTLHRANDSIRAVVSLYTDQAVQKGVEFVVDDTADFSVYTDPRREQQVLAAVVDNAVRFTARGTIRITLSQCMRDELSYVCISVTDSGVGISADFLPHIFEEFRQESEGLSRSHEGSGLGLALAKRLLDQMGGLIEISSTKGEGTQVHIRLPHGHIASDQLNAHQTWSTSARAERSGVMLIGDAPFRRTTRDALEARHAGVRITEVSDVRDAAMILVSSNVASVVVQVENADVDAVRKTAASLRLYVPLQGAYKVAIVRSATQALLERVQEQGFDLALAGPVDLAVASRIAVERALPS